MWYMLVITAIAVLAATFLGLQYFLPSNTRSSFFWFPTSSRQLTAFTSSEAEHCKDIIKARKVVSKNLTNTLRPIESRAHANDRIAKAFSVNNCFTTSDEKVCASFRKNVEQKLDIDELRWAELVAEAKAIVLSVLSSSTQPVRLWTIVQLLSMKLARKIFWDIDPSNTDNDEAVLNLANEINDQWQRSKAVYDPLTVPAWAFSTQEKLISALLSTFPKFHLSAEEDPENIDNPLNILLPGYETLWRVVLRGFLEVKFRSHPQASKWQRVLSAFIADPTRSNLETAVNGTVSPSMIAKETLRLYPPTRRVYRIFQPEQGKPVQVAADIEECHRKPEWEVPTYKVTQFHPERWHAISAEFEEEKFMPFGSKPFMCPARRHKGVAMPFGLTIIAVIIGVLIETINDDYTCDCDLPEDETPLQNERDSYKHATLMRVAKE